MHTLEGKKIVVASHNAGKLREFADLMAPFGFEAKSAKEYDLPEPDETGTTFEENAYIKAFAAAQATGLPALSDDSGLCVDALGGQPGVYTANWAETPEGGRDFGDCTATGRLKNNQVQSHVNDSRMVEIQSTNHDNHFLFKGLIERSEGTLNEFAV